MNDLNAINLEFPDMDDLSFEGSGSIIYYSAEEISNRKPTEHIYLQVYRYYIRDDIHDWCRENSIEYSIKHNRHDIFTIIFKTPEDVLLFKMRWL